MKRIKYIALLFTLALSSGLKAQDTVYVGRMFHVTPGTEVFISNAPLVVDDTLSNSGKVIINGAVKNTLNGEITNSDTMVVSGNWINNTGGRYDDVPNGTVVFNGGGPRLLHNGNGSGGNFHNVVFTGGGLKNINGIFVVDSSIRFVDGIVRTTAPDTLVLNDGDVYGGTILAHVNGMFYQKGFDSLRYPVGDGLVYRPATLMNVPVSPVMPTIGIEHTTGDPGGTPGPSVEAISSVRYWRGWVRSGDYWGSQIRLGYGAGDLIAADPLRAVVVQSDAVNGVYHSIGASDHSAAPPFLTSNFVLGEEYFTFGGSANMVAEPAALLQGLYAAGSMHDSLYDQGLLNQYLPDSTNLMGINMLNGYQVPTVGGEGAVDVLSLYLRSSPSGANLDTTYCWLMTDGSIRDFGSGTVHYATFSNYSTLTPGNNYYVVVDHRNHVPVMYNVAQAVGQDTTAVATFDLTNIVNVYGGGAYLSGGMAQLYNGNADTDLWFYSKYIVDADDFDKVRIPANTTMPAGYLTTDVNLDGVTNATDWTVTKIGVDNMYYSTVPF